MYSQKPGYYWVTKSPRNDFPPEAFLAGFDTNGDEIFIGKAKHESDMLPAKLVPKKNCCFVAYDRQEHEKQDYEILCGTRLKWVCASDGQVPRKSVIGGQTANGENLYIGRVDHLGSNCVGKVQPSKRCCYVPYDSKEISYNHYEILVEI